jgi:hypothetical protein
MYQMSFLSLHLKRKGKLSSFRRYEAAKRRRESKDTIEAASALLEIGCSTDYDQEEAIVYPPNTVCIGTQTDLTTVDLANLENDYIPTKSERTFRSMWCKRIS